MQARPSSSIESSKSSEEFNFLNSDSFSRSRSVPNAGFHAKLLYKDLPPNISKLLKRHNDGDLSPRSKRISEYLLAPYTVKADKMENQARGIGGKLAELRKEVDATLKQSRKISAQSNLLLRNYFASISGDKLSSVICEAFKSFDSNNDGVLHPSEILPAILNMGISVEQAEILLEHFDIDRSGALDLQEFELMVRAAFERDNHLSCLELDVTIASCTTGVILSDGVTFLELQDD